MSFAAVVHKSHLALNGIQSSLTPSPSTTYAYLWCKADWNNKKTALNKIFTDQRGIT